MLHLFRQRVNGGTLDPPAGPSELAGGPELGRVPPVDGLVSYRAEQTGIVKERKRLTNDSMSEAFGGAKIV